MLYRYETTWQECIKTHVFDFWSEELVQLFTNVSLNHYLSFLQRWMFKVTLMPLDEICSPEMKNCNNRKWSSWLQHDRKSKKKKSILTSRVSSRLDRQLAEMARAFSRRETSANVLLQKTICHVGPFYTIHHVVSSFTHHTAWEGSYAFVREITVRVTKRSEEKCEKTE